MLPTLDNVSLITSVFPRVKILLSRFFQLMILTLKSESSALDYPSFSSLEEVSIARRSCCTPLEGQQAGCTDSLLPIPLKGDSVVWRPSWGIGLFNGRAAVFWGSLLRFLPIYCFLTWIFLVRNS